MKFSGFRIPGVGVARGVVACRVLAALGGALAVSVVGSVDVVAPSVGVAGIVIVV